MQGNLDILVVDDRPDTVRFLTEFLVQRCRRVDVAASVREAMTAVTRRRAAGERYHLVISDFVMPEADGLSLLRELRGRQDDVPFVFATGYRSLNPAFEPEAQRLGAIAILDKPIDLRRVEEIINSTTATFRKKKEEAQGEQPFFGTSRMYRRASDGAPPPPPAAPPASSALEPRVAPVARPPGGTASYTAAPAAQAPALEPLRPQALTPKGPPPGQTPMPQPVLPPGRQTPPGQPVLPVARQTPPPAPPQPVTGYQRRPTGAIPLSTTARIRRSVDPAPPPPGGSGTARIARTSTPQPPTAFTTRVRRGIEGTASIHRGAARTESGRMVACSMCGKSFLVVSKPEAYTTVCLHCGQLQRIEPL